MRSKVKVKLKRNSRILAAVLAVCLHYPLAYGDERKTPLQLTLYQAVKATLQDSLNIKLNKLSVDVARASEQAQAGAFDVNVSFSAQSSSSLITQSPYDLGLPVDDDDDDPRTILDQDVHTLSSSISKKFRNGISANLSYVLTQLDHRVPDPTGQELPTNNTGDFNFSIAIPLLKGAGTVSSAAAEIAAGQQTRASEADYNHLVSSTVLTTVNSYWNYAAAYSIKEYLSKTKQAIDTWYRKNNAADNKLLNGYRAEKQSRLIESDNELQSAALALAKATGIPADAMARFGEPDIGGFPKNWRQELKNIDETAITDRWIDAALQNRQDILALKIRLEAGQTLLAKAKKDLNPSLDLSLGYGTQGFGYGNGFRDAWRVTYDKVRSPAYSGSLVLNYPIGNDAAIGSYKSSFAAKEIARLQLDEAIRQLKLSVRNQIKVLITSRDKAVEADKSLQSYVTSMREIVTQKTIDDLNDINSLLTLQDRLDDAAENYFKALSDLANAIVNSRYEIGLLVSSDQILDEEINFQVLTSIPKL